jgi:4-amino-4-deoxy-L-arabinose transferase-like glycosyltransferase
MRMMEMNSAALSSSLRKEVTVSWALDVLIVAGLLLVAWLGYFATAQFAANLPQDGVDFAVPAVNLLERGRLAVSAYGHDFPSAHPFGTSLLLLPSYMVWGHFLGNGIYSLFCCAFGTIALTYIIGKWLGGRVCGCVAALFLITNYGFWQYSQKIMSEVPSVFLATAVLALLLSSRNRRRPALLWLAAGGVLGFAMTVRYDNALLLAPALVLLACEDTWRERMRRAGVLLVGMAPFLIILGAYHQATFGSPWRTSYRYWGLAGTASQPLFSPEYVTKAGFMHLRVVEPGAASIIDGNGTFYAKSLLAESDTSRIFGHPLYWELPSRRPYQMLALLRTALGMIGFLACLIGWRTHASRRQFLLWLVVSTLTFVFLYMPYNWQEERFLLRLIPGFCLANAVGVAVLLALWPGKAARAMVIILVSALVLTLAFLNLQAGFPTGNDAALYTSLTYSAQHMESNAVVVSNFDPLRVDAYVIRGTDRIAVPLGRGNGINVFVGHDVSATPLHPFVASEDPARLREFLHSGKSVYWLVNDPWTGKPSAELDTLQQSFRLEPWAAGVAKDGIKHPFFGRFYELTEGH